MSPTWPTKTEMPRSLRTLNFWFEAPTSLRLGSAREQKKMAAPSVVSCACFAWLHHITQTVNHIFQIWFCSQHLPWNRASHSDEKQTVGEEAKGGDEKGLLLRHGAVTGWCRSNTWPLCEMKETLKVLMSYSGEGSIFSRRKFSKTRGRTNLSQVWRWGDHKPYLYSK